MGVVVGNKAEVEASLLSLIVWRYLCSSLLRFLFPGGCFRLEEIDGDFG